MHALCDELMLDNQGALSRNQGTILGPDHRDAAFLSCSQATDLFQLYLPDSQPLRIPRFQSVPGAPQA
ncbi:hypothetical protein PCASD_04526 [Puccinia coronata f. sp. avenae]|uniref:Uncharacterized protein n=1 Tax=Puccinia coronata f. sp. avenae TaxID=200324 RepID=A0A2N5V320_9BASI|nr:hypothetical protein PCASD_15134 [Puccinia coronata f. sp. avenae]PLW44371.1 hypothetical protein PCASD_04526 [Puccinia coronata f. sp. avenae]